MYQHGRKPKKKSNPKILIRMSVILGVSIIIGAYILHKDVANGSKERTTVPILTEVKEDEKDIIKVDESLFYMELPSDWVKTNRVQGNKTNYYEFKSTKKGADDRRLLLHIDVMPPSYKINRMQPVIVSGDSLNLGNLSDNCVNYSNLQNPGSNQTSEAKWENVTFVCDPIVNNQTIGTGNSETGIATKVGSHTYFFYYEDRNIRPDNKILSNILKSFKAKN